MPLQAKIDPSFQINCPTQRLQVEHQVITAFDAQILEPKRRPFEAGIDRSPEHLPFAHNQFKLANEELVSASRITFSGIDSTCTDMIAAQGPMPSTITRFWSMVFESNSNLIAMLTDLVEQDAEGSKIKCTQYWPEKVGETLLLNGYGQVSLISNQRIFKDGDEELWYSQIQLIVGGIERVVNHYWIKGWKDGKALNSLELQNLLIERIHQNVKNYPKSPPIIHCSAGVGRTGTIIGSYLAKHLLTWSPFKENWIKKDNLCFEITLYLRYQRSHLIHTLDQYISFHRFIHFYAHH